MEVLDSQSAAKFLFHVNYMYLSTWNYFILMTWNSNV